MDDVNDKGRGLIIKSLISQLFKIIKSVKNLSLSNWILLRLHSNKPLDARRL
jgi:hypothetical protein